MFFFVYLSEKYSRQTIPERFYSYLINHILKAINILKW